MQNSLVTRCRSCSLQKFTRYSLQNSLVIRGNKSLITQCKKWLITCSNYHKSLKKGESLVFFLVNIQMGKNSATTWYKSKKWVRSYQISQLVLNLCQLTNTNLKFFEAILFKFKSCLNGGLSMKTIYLWPKMKQLIALSQKNKQNRVLCSILQFQNLMENLNF